MAEVLWATGAAADTPAAGYITVYSDSGDSDHLKQKDSGGVVIDLASGGDVFGPAASTDNAIARWDGAGGDMLQDSGVIISDADDVTGMNTLTLPNTGLHLLDTNASHDLIIAPGSDVTADRTLTLTTGDSDRTITLSGNPTLADWFDQSVKQAASPIFANLTVLGQLIEPTLISMDGNIRLDGNDLQIDADDDSYLHASGDDVVELVLAGASGEFAININGAEDFTFTANAFNVLTGSVINIPNTGLHILDTNASHDLIVAPGSDLTADHTLTFTTGDSDRTITLSGNPTLADWFDQAVKSTSGPTFATLAITGGLGVWLDDNVPVTFGDDSDASILYDEAGDDRVEVTGATWYFDSVDVGIDGHVSIYDGNELRLYDTGSSHYISQSAPALTANEDYIWPAAADDGKYLKVAADGTMSWDVAGLSAAEALVYGV